MAKEIKSKITALDTEISIITTVGSEDDYVSLTDIARYRNSDEPNVVVGNWLRNRGTIEYLGLWETMYNPNFKPLEFDGFKKESGANSFTLSPQKWIATTDAIGLISKSGRYGGGTFAHKDIAFEFASWISPEFKLYIIKDYQRLKEDAEHRYTLDWNVKRILAKANYRIHTDAIKTNLIPDDLPKNKQGFVYAEEADMLNVALFGMTAGEWRHKNPDVEGNIRDYASIEQLLVMGNLEAINALLIQEGRQQSVRLTMLRKLAVEQLTKISNSKSAADLSALHNQLGLPEK